MEAIHNCSFNHSRSLIAPFEKFDTTQIHEDRHKIDDEHKYASIWNKLYDQLQNDANKIDFFRSYMLDTNFVQWFSNLKMIINSRFKW